MMFSRPYNPDRYRTPPEINNGETLVETAGYIPAQKKIENMILAGQRLVDYRKSQNYDFADGKIDEDFMDPTRSPNFDLADATQMQLQAEANLAAAKAAAEAAAKAAEEAQKALEASQTTPVSPEVNTAP